MTRRNLSDVLRQEVQKEGSEPKAATAKAAHDSGAKTARSGSTAKSEGSVATVASPETETGQVADLKVALSQSTAHEKELQAQVKTLQAEVKRHQKEIDRLEDQVSRVSQLETELAEAKALILQLSEENTQLIESLDAQKPKAPAAKPTVSKTPLALRPLPAHSIQHGSSTGSNASKTVDVGWMD